MMLSFNITCEKIVSSNKHLSNLQCHSNSTFMLTLQNFISNFFFLQNTTVVRIGTENVKISIGLHSNVDHFLAEESPDIFVVRVSKLFFLNKSFSFP